MTPCLFPPGLNPMLRSYSAIKLPKGYCTLPWSGEVRILTCNSMCINWRVKDTAIVCAQAVLRTDTMLITPPHLALISNFIPVTPHITTLNKEEANILAHNRMFEWRHTKKTRTPNFLFLPGDQQPRPRESSWLTCPNIPQSSTLATATDTRIVGQ